MHQNARDLKCGQMQGLKERLNHEQSSVPMKSPINSSDKRSLSASKRPFPSYGAMSEKRDQKSFTFKNNRLSTDVFTDMPEEEMVQKIPIYQIAFKEKGNSLRIITATIDSMKHWSQYTDSIPLLFEILATLDSAVTCGDHGSKVFLLRDGKSSVPCTFYEIDRDLPRLIRGRVHRSMGNYDKKKNLFKCVAVRPASTVEQQTFQEFITAANNEMERKVKAISEI
ncbi:spermatogenesis-associated protein 22 [Discoglossus pictus]